MEPIWEGTMQTVGNALLAIGAGLGVWVITNLGDTGPVDWLIVAGIIGVGAAFKVTDDV